MLWGGRWEGGSCLGMHVRIKDFKIKKKKRNHEEIKIKVTVWIWELEVVGDFSRSSFSVWYGKDRRTNVVN